MLIVIAMITILIAISIPVLENSLEKARQSADAANIKSAYSEAYLNAYKEDSKASVVTPKMTHKKDWNREYSALKIGTNEASLPDVTDADITVEVAPDGTVVFR